MSLLNDKDMHEILHNSKLGLWRVEFEEGKEPRFFADAMMAERRLAELNSTLRREQELQDDYYANRD